MEYTDAMRTHTMTYNNLGVYFKMLKKQNQAIKYLKQVLVIEQAMLVNDSVEVTEICQTHVNICTIYSEMGKHEIALVYAKEAVRILEIEYDKKEVEGFTSETDKFQHCSLVATAFHNAAVEYEHTKDYSSALIHY
jgi:tetratricopeptide (TPR) repeat protein